MNYIIVVVLFYCKWKSSHKGVGDTEHIHKIRQLNNQTSNKELRYNSKW